MSVFLNSRLEEQENPSVFDVTAYQGFQQITRPALEKLLDVLRSYSPTYFNALHIFRDEVYLLLDSILQYHYLKQFSASFAQQFYSLERKAVNAKYDKISITRNFTIQILLPYLHKKINQQFHKSRENEMDGIVTSSEFTSSVRTWFVKLYPFFHASWGIVNIGIMMLFTLNKTKYHSLESILSGYNLQYKQEDKMVDSREESRFNLMLSTSARALATGLEIGCFFLQVLEHYQSTASDKKFGDKIVPAPKSVHHNNLSPSKCPLCTKTRKDATVVPGSGIIYCYSCIAAYVRKKKRCAITRIPCESNQLVRLFP